MSEHMVLVTAALTGIGLATATAFGRDGASVVVSGRDDEEDEALTAELRTLGGNAGYLRPTSVSRMPLSRAVHDKDFSARILRVAREIAGPVADAAPDESAD